MLRTSPIPFLLAAWLCIACSVEKAAASGPTAEPRAKWAAERPADYVIEECVSGLVKHCTQSAVADGRVTRARETLPDARELDVSERPEPIEARFDELDSVHAHSECHDMSQSFDPTYGYPTAFGAFCATESFETRVTCFITDTSDLDACGSPPAAGGSG